MSYRCGGCGKELSGKEWDKLFCSLCELSPRDAYLRGAREMAERVREKFHVEEIEGSRVVVFLAEHFEARLDAALKATERENGHVTQAEGRTDVPRYAVSDLRKKLEEYREHLEEHPRRETVGRFLDWLEGTVD